MDPIARLRRGRSGMLARIALPEATDDRVLAAAVEALAAGICQPVLVGPAAEVRAAWERAGQAGEPLDVIDPMTDWESDELEALLAARLGGDRRRARDLARRPGYYAGLLTASGRVDGAVMGAQLTSGDTVRIALATVGLAPGVELLSSCFLISVPDGRELIYSDAGVVPDPSAAQLAQIAISAADSCRRWLGVEPRVALLSFSTKGSAEHPRVAKVRSAVEILSAQAVDFLFDGELQADAALDPGVAARKAPGSPLVGGANVLIFPDLDAANIAYKLTQRLAKARAIGPLLQGTARPIHDLSRGCSARDVLDVLTVAAAGAARSGE